MVSVISVSQHGLSKEWTGVILPKFWNADIMYSVALCDILGSPMKTWHVHNNMKTACKT